MRALQYRQIGRPPEVVEVPTPEPGPGQVRLRVTAAGACHSDIFVMGLPEGAYTMGLPLTLGHEGAGVVDSVGAGVDESLVGQLAAVYGAWGCGNCARCASGAENYCQRAAALGIAPPGLGAPGAMAEFMVVDSPRHLVPIDGLDARAVVSLTDAGLTPYHAIKGSLDVLAPGSTAVVIGVGGLGHVAIQMLRAMSSATVVALDVDAGKLELARHVGAHHAITSGPDAAAQIAELNAGRGCEAVFDFVAAQSTLDLGRAVIAAGGHQVLVGVGAGSLAVGLLAGPYEWQIRAPYWGTRPELFEVFDLARAGLVGVETEIFSLDESPKAYQMLHDGALRGRAVVVPGV
jgi:propanol-preferring alcohol dehydrogenase